MTKGAIGGLILIALAFLVVYVDYRSAEPSYAIGSLRTGNPSELIALTNSQAEIPASYYDTLESPNGTDYQVPSGATLYLGAFMGLAQAAAGTNVTIEVGYGDDAVAATSTAPTFAVPVARWTYVTANGVDGLLQVVWAAIPADKYVYARVSQPGNWQVTGLER